jgi:sugar transferase (PEP-CTERM/EpsH1 system associated)
MDILFLSHCVPNPPDKGEKIRAFHELNHLSKKHRVHLACFARSSAEMKDAEDLKDRCASVYAEPLLRLRALMSAAVRFGLGGCLTTSFYRSPRMRRYVESLHALPLSAAVVYSSAMAQYAPPQVPMWLDMVDVDSEKWMQYGATRWPGLAYRIEGRRLRAREAAFAAKAACTFLVTPQERDLLQQIAPGSKTVCATNGVDFSYFDPLRACESAGLASRRFIAFVGSMEYYPNVDACVWFAKSVLPELRRLWPDLEFFIVGRNPAKAVRNLAKLSGVVVTGAVPDVRPYLAFARSIVAPLKIARGVQNKVLEALAMGKCVCASPAVARTFGANIPKGVAVCDSAADYTQALAAAAETLSSPDPEIRRIVKSRFSWGHGLDLISAEMDLQGQRTPVGG